MVARRRGTRRRRRMDDDHGPRRGGFIGGHLVGSLLDDGHEVTPVDIKPTNRWYQRLGDAEHMVADLRLRDTAFAAVGDPAITALEETDTYPADPEDGDER